MASEESFSVRDMAYILDEDHHEGASGKAGNNASDSRKALKTQLIIVIAARTIRHQCVSRSGIASLTSYAMHAESQMFVVAAFG